MSKPDLRVSAPSAGTWHNPGSLSIQIPIGVWDAKPAETPAEWRPIAAQECEWCAREAPCHCNVAAGGTCKCSCGRCQAPFPLPDEGTL